MTIFETIIHLDYMIPHFFTNRPPTKGELKNLIDTRYFENNFESPADRHRHAFHKLIDEDRCQTHERVVIEL